ncbi:unnamed protein product [Anisakis simplex]|uniref:Flocculation protein FLO11-like n=1 Tax=Anisakis simplex TaxID=6269 RepID=A0A0M3JTA0_ANISI|nr:unnamed protein product [Anisakis simplex]
MMNVAYTSTVVILAIFMQISHNQNQLGTSTKPLASASELRTNADRFRNNGEQVTRDSFVDATSLDTTAQQLRRQKRAQTALAKHPHHSAALNDLNQHQSLSSTLDRRITQILVRVPNSFNTSSSNKSSKTHRTIQRWQNVITHPTATRQIRVRPASVARFRWKQQHQPVRPEQIAHVPFMRLAQRTQILANNSQLRSSHHRQRIQSSTESILQVKPSKIQHEQLMPSQEAFQSHAPFLPFAPSSSNSINDRSNRFSSGISSSFNVSSRQQNAHLLRPQDHESIPFRSSSSHSLQSSLPSSMFAQNVDDTPAVIHKSTNEAALSKTLETATPSNPSSTISQTDPTTAQMQLSDLSFVTVQQQFIQPTPVTPMTLTMSQIQVLSDPASPLTSSSPQSLPTVHNSQIPSDHSPHLLSPTFTSVPSTSNQSSFHTSQSSGPTPPPIVELPQSDIFKSASQLTHQIPNEEIIQSRLHTAQNSIQFEQESGPIPPAPQPPRQQTPIVDRDSAPGFLPPSDSVVSKLNSAEDFLALAKSIHLKRRAKGTF